MIISEPATSFETTAVAPPDLVGIIGTQILRPNDTPALGGDRSTAGITERVIGSTHTGYYTLSRVAPALIGRYTLLWDIGEITAGQIATEELLVVVHGEIPLDASEYQPTVAEVGALLRARTVDVNSVELGTFTPDTRPTDAEAQLVIRNAAGKLASRFGPTVAAPLALAAREVVALRAAMQIELGFFGDQIQAGRSPFNELKALYDQAYADLIEARRDLGADQEAGTADDLSVAGLPSFSFVGDFDPSLSHVPGTELPWSARSGW